MADRTVMLRGRAHAYARLRGALAKQRDARGDQGCRRTRSTRHATEKTTGARASTGQQHIRHADLRARAPRRAARNQGHGVPIASFEGTGEESALSRGRCARLGTHKIIVAAAFVFSPEISRRLTKPNEEELQASVAAVAFSSVSFRSQRRHPGRATS
ncbi:hypothetical protein MTO96_001947 [Rhipicephalus appendiculatus]